MKKLPTISIVTPSYNQGDYLEQTMKSVLDQQYPHFEYIVMDGGSTDNSVEIIKQYASQLTYWESHPDKGQTDAISRGFLKATGDILYYLNSDDILLPGALELVGQWFMSHPNEHWVTGGMFFIGSNNDLIRQRLDRTYYLWGDSVSFQQLKSIGVTSFGQQSTFWRRDAYFEVGELNKNLHFCFDFDLFLKLSKKSKSGHIPSFLSSFRIHPQSKTMTIEDIRLKEVHALQKKYQADKIYQPILLIVYYIRYLVISKFVLLKIALGLIKINKIGRNHQ